MATRIAAFEGQRVARRVSRCRIVTVVVMIMNRRTVVIVSVVVVRVLVDVPCGQRRRRAEQRGHE